jgi:uncharacterized protein (DUF885 family)
VSTDTSPSTRFTEVTEAYLAQLYEAHPVMATAMGVHEFDALLPDSRAFAIDEELRRARAYLHEIDKLSVVDMPPAERIDYRLARSSVQVQIARHEHARPHERFPDLYVDGILFGVYLLTAREFADVESRAVSALGRLAGVPEYLLHARQNLVAPPRVFVETAIDGARGGQAFFAEQVPQFAERVGNATLKRELLDANEDALAALEDYARYLESEVLPDADSQFALGPEVFDYTLRVGHFMDETGSDLVAVGWETLDAVKAEMRALAEQIEPGTGWEQIVAELKADHPSADELVRAYAQEMERARDFVREKGITEIPDGEALRVTETPRFQRQMLPYAAYVAAAPFEQKQEGIFWVTPVPADATPEQAEAQLQGHSRYNIPIIALHEAYPGHHLQFSRAGRIPSKFRRQFADSNLLVEGWALYCEEMMYEQGFYTDPRVRLMVLKNQLWRASRVIIDVELHAGRMSISEAVQFLVEHAKLEEVNARAEVRRYCSNPTQPMTYIMGKRQIMDLKSSLERKQGTRFDLRAFHNDLLSYGAVPPRLIKEDMLAV